MDFKDMHGTMEACQTLPNLPAFFPPAMSLTAATRYLRCLSDLVQPRSCQKDWKQRMLLNPFLDPETDHDLIKYLTNGAPHTARLRR